MKATISVSAGRGFRIGFWLMWMSIQAAFRGTGVSFDFGDDLP